MKASKITAVDFFGDLNSPYARRWFWGAFLLLAGICLLLVYFINGSITKEITTSFLIEVATGSLIILGFYFLYFHLIGPNTAAHEVNVTRPNDIKKQMEALPLGVSKYMFWGRSGGYFRAEPLLKLDEQARKNKHRIKVEVLLPDPGEARLVESYRGILKSLDEDIGENPLLQNVLATSMACAILESNNMYLEINIHLSRFLPAFRVDLSDNGAILTQDDPNKSALYFKFGSEFFEMFRNTMINERDISREIKWCKNLFEGLKLEEKSCNENTLKAFDIEVANWSKIQPEVARLISKRPHRY